MNHTSTILVDRYGAPLKVNGHSKPREKLAAALNDLYAKRKANLRYDAAGSSTDFSKYWANADGRDADAANSSAVRRNFRNRSRYEAGSNGFYDGILETHVNMVIGVGPSLRMLTKKRNFNQFVEKRFYQWAQEIQLRRKLWCKAHARYQDGEGIGLLQTNDALKHEVKLDLSLIEAEQCATPQLPINPIGYIDGIKFDALNNIEWYDILPFHPGSMNRHLAQSIVEPIHVPPSQVLHWFKLERPGAHRGIPALGSTLNVGAAARRWREATLAGAESAAEFNILLKSQFEPSEDDESIKPMSLFPVEKRMMTLLPNGLDVFQMKSEFPTATHSEFNRTLLSEQASPLSQPYNVAAHDSSTYSFASGKLDTLCYRAAIDVERQDCNDLVLDPLFAAWFSEWSILDNAQDVAPDHQWDWPVHPVIDAVQEATAIDVKLKNGTLTLRQAFSDQGQDIEDQLTVMAEDYFGDSSDENVSKMREILLHTHYPVAVATPPQVAQPQKPQLAAAGAA